MGSPAGPRPVRPSRRRAPLSSPLRAPPAAPSAPSARRNSSSSAKTALTSIVPVLPCLLVMVCSSPKDPVIATSPAYHDHPPQRLLQNFPDTTDFNAAGPNQLWVADITYVPTMAGFLYLAVVLDAWSRKIVGWAMANHLRAELVLDAMEMAVGQRRPKDVIHHSDQGSQYTSVAFGKRCGEAGVRPSMGSVGDAYDNAMAESFFSTLEAELLSRRRFASQAEAKMACFSYIEGWYNPVRLHSGLGYRSPIT